MNHWIPVAGYPAVRQQSSGIVNSARSAPGSVVRDPLFAEAVPVLTASAVNDPVVQFFVPKLSLVVCKVFG